MIEWNYVTKFSSTMLLDETGLAMISESGCSRVPVYKNNNKNSIVGLCLVKNLIRLKPNENVKLEDYATLMPLIVSKDMNLYDLLNYFQEMRSHMALVVENEKECQMTRNNFNEKKSGNVKFLGIITLEDIIEEIIQKEIHDEFESEKIGKFGLKSHRKSIKSKSESNISQSTNVSVNVIIKMKDC